MKVISWYKILCSLGLTTIVESYNILIVIMLGTVSHKSNFQPLVEHLGKQGHNVTFIHIFNNKKKSFENVEEVVLGYYEKVSNRTIGASFNPYEPAQMNSWTFMQTIHNFVITSCREFWKDPKMTKFINSKHRHYDVVILDGVINECGLPLVSKFNAPYVLLFPAGVYGYYQWLFNIPVPHSYIPTSMTSLVLPQMDFKQRLANSFQTLTTVLVQRYHLYVLDGVLQTVCPFKAPPLIDIMSNTSLLFSNEHTAIDYAKPAMPTIIHVGGIGINNNNASLPIDLQEFMDGAGEAGVIYFSFGSVVPMKKMPDPIKSAFKNVFGKLKQRVIWKFEDPEEFTGAPDNVKILKWAPQQEILAHAKLRFFISHGGMASVLESLSFGVPLVLIPFFYDQFPNTAKGVYHGYAIHLAKENLTVESIDWTINEMLTNPKYKANALKTQALLSDDIMPPVAKAMYWIEYVIRHKGAPHLRNEIASKLYFFQYFLLDIIAAILIALILAIWLTVFVCKLSYKLVKSVIGRCKCIKVIKLEVNKIKKS